LNANPTWLRIIIKYRQIKHLFKQRYNSIKIKINNLTSVYNLILKVTGKIRKSYKIKIK